jgi:hypothetical protein
MQTCQRFRPSFIIPRQAVQARDTANTALYHPLAWQEDEAFLDLRQLHDFKRDATDCRILRQLLAISHDDGCALTLEVVLPGVRIRAEAGISCIRLPKC